MACPWFYPLQRLGAAHSIVPLGDIWAGSCRAPGAQAEAPAQHHDLIECCNLGYARGKCRRLPAEGPDAVRFTITADTQGLVSICCIAEKDYLPFSRANFEYDVRNARFAPPPPRDSIMERQAWACIASYLARKEIA